MNLVFLQAALPLTKTIVGETVAPYPHVSKVTSHTERVDSLDGMLAVLKKHAELGHCLFNGQLKVPLKHESRAGKTLRGTTRDWIVFDYDKVQCDSVEDILPPAMANVSYILQKSASMFVNQNLFSGHVFALLDRPTTEEELKSWFETINFDNPILKDQLTLTGSKTALHWPLDKSGAYDSKLIYIAPPKLIGVEPLIQPLEAISLVRRKKPRLSIPSFTPTPKSTIDNKVNELREQIGLKARRLDTKKWEDGELLIDSEKQLISNVKPIGDHYIKFNVGQGDSMGYWIDLHNPHIIKNFKGEPYMLTEEVDPDFFKALVKQAPKTLSKPPLDDGTEILAFFNTNKESMVTTGIWTPLDRTLRVDKSSMAAASAWLATYGIMKHGHLDHFDTIFDPTSNAPQYVPGTKVINTFRATDYMLKTKNRAKPSTLKELPPIIGKTFRSMLGGVGKNDPPQLFKFINWLAFIFQTRKKAQTAWVFQGRTGTGKGTLVKHILAPLFGTDLVKNIQFPLIATPFNDYLENALIIVVEEATISAVANQADIMQKLKHYVTDTPITIHQKNKSPVARPNYTNFIFNSNERNAVAISSDDRRFNICPRQDVKLEYLPNEYIIIERGDELDALADMLANWEVDEEMVREVPLTEEAEIMHELTTPIGDQLAEAILKGDIQFFIDRMPSDMEAAGDFGSRVSTLPMYRDLIDAVIADKKPVLDGRDLYVLFRTLMPDPRYFSESPIQRNRYFVSKGLVLKTVWDPIVKDSVRGIPITWKKASHKPKSKPKTTSNVVRIK